LSCDHGMASDFDKRFPSTVYLKVRQALPGKLFERVVKHEHHSGNMFWVEYETRGRDDENDHVQLGITISLFKDDTPVVGLSAMTSKGYGDTGLTDDDFEGAHWKPSKELIQGDDQEVEIPADADQAADKILSIFKKYRISSMTPADRVVRRFLGFKYQPKETKQHKVEKLRDAIREATGISKSQAESIADSILRKRDLAALAVQKGWPVNEDGLIEGPSGTFDPTSVE